MPMASMAKDSRLMHVRRLRLNVKRNVMLTVAACTQACISMKLQWIQIGLTARPVISTVMLVVIGKHTAEQITACTSKPEIMIELFWPILERCSLARQAPSILHRLVFWHSLRLPSRFEAIV